MLRKYDPSLLGYSITSKTWSEPWMAVQKQYRVTSRKTVLCKTPPSPGRLTVGRVLIKRLMRQWERQTSVVKRRETSLTKSQKVTEILRVALKKQTPLIRMTTTAWACVLRRGRSHLSTSLGSPPITRCRHRRRRRTGHRRRRWEMRRVTSVRSLYCFFWLKRVTHNLVRRGFNCRLCKRHRCRWGRLSVDYWNQPGRNSTRLWYS